MTQVTARRDAPGLLGQAQAWITRTQHHVSDRAHRAGDIDARAQGWTVTHTTSRLGFGGRTYRDPRFDRRTSDD